jgi:ABC-2 type transport system permease protein
MLWYKSWLETRWRFLIGLGVLILMACGAVFSYPAVQELMPLASQTEVKGRLGDLIKDAVKIQSDYRGYVWYQWIQRNLSQTWTLFAILLGSGGLLAHASGGAPLFTLALPVSRQRVLWVRAATGLAELLVLATVPFLIIPVLSPAIAQHYSLRDVAIHAMCIFVGGSLFFSVALFLSTMFSDLWRPLLITCAIAVMLALAAQIPGLADYSISPVMSAESYFRAGAVPWTGLLTAAAISAGIMYSAATNFARQDF